MRYKIKSVKSREELCRRITVLLIVLVLFFGIAVSNIFEDEKSIPDEWLYTHKKGFHEEAFF